MSDVLIVKTAANAPLIEAIEALRKQLAASQANEADLENQLSEMTLGLDDAHGRVEELEADVVALREALTEIGKASSDGQFGRLGRDTALIDIEDIVTEALGDSYFQIGGDAT